jgi:hypothetical protein
MLIVLVSDRFNSDTDSESCSYVRDQKKLHPFEFYSKRQEKYVCITTHYQNKKTAHFDSASLTAELFDLDISAIKKGDINMIPSETKVTIRQIANYILANWV